MVVDDRKDEKYQQVFEKISDINIILSHLEHCGKGAKIKTALTYQIKDLWDGNVIGVMECDGQHSQEDMRKLWPD